MHVTLSLPDYVPLTDVELSASQSFIIRVRRPARLDEYVVRTEAQFLKYFKVVSLLFRLRY